MTCTCFARDALGNKMEPEAYQWVDFVLWALFPACPLHDGYRYASPVWTSRLGQVRTAESAAGTALTEGQRQDYD